MLDEYTLLQDSILNTDRYSGVSRNPWDPRDFLNITEESLNALLINVTISALSLNTWFESVNVTDTPPELNDRVCGPKVVGPTFDTHNHVGKPTRPIESGPGSGMMPIATGANVIESRNCAANTAGSAVSGTDADQNASVVRLPLGSVQV